MAAEFTSARLGEHSNHSIIYCITVTHEEEIYTSASDFSRWTEKKSMNKIPVYIQKHHHKIFLILPRSVMSLLQKPVTFEIKLLFS